MDNIIDIDECSNYTLHGCNQKCTNLPCLEGRYSCSCYNGYSLMEDNRTCTGKVDVNLKKTILVIFFQTRCQRMLNQ